MTSKKDLSERDICTKYILPDLVKAGWDMQTQIREEVFFTEGRIYVRGDRTTRGKRKRADFILYYKAEIPLAIARELGLPVFIIFDADGNITRPDQRVKHERDNRALLTLLNANIDLFPATITMGTDHVIWPTNIGDIVKNDFGGNYERLKETARLHYAQEGDLEKNDMFIAEWLTAASNENLRSPTLQTLCETILDFARGEH